MAWREFTITMPAELSEAVTGALFDLGCLGISEEGGAFKAYFPESVAQSAVMNALAGLEGVKAVLNTVEEQDWYAPWKARFGPLHTAGLTICLPWSVCGAGPGERLVVLDPGQAFGTGEHPTTKNVLGMLKRWADAQQGLSGKRFLDLGTGTGILVIAACMFGIRDVTALDTGAEAMETAGRNLALNAMTDKVRLMSGSIAEAGRGYDMIAANLFLEALLDVLPGAVRALNPDGRIIVSGLLKGQEEEIYKSARALGLDMDEEAVEEGWVTALFHLPGPRP